jgi:Domain of unknown function (DUF892)
LRHDTPAARREAISAGFTVFLGRPRHFFLELPICPTDQPAGARVGNIGAGSRVEHYEMAGYTTAINLAKQLGNSEIVSLLSQTLNEEEAADKKLRKIGQQL